MHIQPLYVEAFSLVLFCDSSTPRFAGLWTRDSSLYAGCVRTQAELGLLSAAGSKAKRSAGERPPTPR